MVEFDCTVDEDGVTLTPRAGGRGFLSRLMPGQRPRDLSELSAQDARLALALADLHMQEEDAPGTVAINGETIRLSHQAVAALDSESAAAIGLPPVPDLTFRTDAEGIVGSQSFRLVYEWLRSGRRESTSRTGAILSTRSGLRRIPSAILTAIEIAEAQRRGGEADDWAALARFRQALESEHRDAGRDRIAMTDFLSGLEVHLAGSFSIDPREVGNRFDFDVVPHGRPVDAGDGDGDEAQLVQEGDLRQFQARVRDRGALPAYRLGRGSYLVVDGPSRPVLEVMSRMKRAPADERDAFVRNPFPAILKAMEVALEAQGELEGLTAAGRQEAIERAAGRSFIETEGYAERVLGVGIWRPEPGDREGGSGTTWMPEIFGPKAAATIEKMDLQQLTDLRATVQEAVAGGATSVAVGGEDVRVDASVVATLDAEIEKRRTEGATAEPGKPDEPDATEVPEEGPHILLTQEDWDLRLTPRASLLGDALPASIVTELHPHQIESFAWAVSAWRAGLPGILNADEQGLGKTLQTIAFLAWLKEHTAREDAAQRGPVLIVAPTSLLQTWEKEVAQHLEEPGLGHLIRLYGGSIAGFRRSGGAGKETSDGHEKLDLDHLHEAVHEGRSHRFWLLTTYTTLTNYQHSLGRIPFAAVVFDEIQALKNSQTLAAFAARAMKADFRIGLTGTPIENSTLDLWAIMDQLCPGALGSRAAYRERYGEPEEERLRELHVRLFRGGQDLPPIALRRLKEDAAAHLPAKSRRLHPRVMPPAQAERYEDARRKLGNGGPGAALKMLHHIRGVSLHPTPDAASEEFVALSGRLSAVFDLLREIRAQGERALVFIEDRRMQHRFREFAQREFGLGDIDIINGSTPIRKRQQIVERFQRHLDRDEGFDILILGPKAAGTGLTLTAATHVVHLSRWWNPAVEEQCNDRVHRIGQTRSVSVHLPMSVHPRYGEDSFDCHLHSLMQRKRRLARSALWPMGDTAADAAGLGASVGREAHLGETTLEAAIGRLFARDGIASPGPAADGSYPIE